MSDDVSFSEPPQFEVTAADRQWAMLAHLSTLIAMWAAKLTFLGPLIVWLIKKDQSKFVDDQGKEALNFQLNILVLLVLFVGFLGPLGIGITALAIVMPILGAIKANSGEAYRYPYIIRVVK